MMLIYSIRDRTSRLSTNCTFRSLLCRRLQNSLAKTNPAGKTQTVDSANKSSALKAWTQAFDASDAPDTDMVQGMRLSDDMLA